MIAMNGSFEPFKKKFKVHIRIKHNLIMLNWWCNIMFWYHWLSGDKVLVDELINSISIRVQVKVQVKVQVRFQEYAFMEKKIKIEEKTTIKWTYENMVKF